MQSSHSDHSIAHNSVDDDALLLQRRDKLSAWRKSANAYPNHFKPQQYASQIVAQAESLSSEQLAQQAIAVSMAGRIMLKRVMGKASFATLQDASGRFQIYVSDNDTNIQTHQDFKHADIGDIYALQGVLFRTKTGELSVRVKHLEMLVKSLRPLPDKFHGLEDVDMRYRQRYLDLIVNADTRERFIKRSRLTQALRTYFITHDFLEVETPMLHPIPGGAIAKPFVTHHHALDQAMYLRVAPELYLKRLIVGGFERVFELNRNFRNEGISPRHNPEFTMLEFYVAYWDYRDIMAFTETLLRDIVTQINIHSQLTCAGCSVDFASPFAKLTMQEAILKHVSHYRTHHLDDDDWIRSELTQLRCELKPQMTHGELVLMLFETVAEEKLWHPTFIVDYPREVSPLARANDHDASITERFELFITGREIANGFSELNDPEDQAERFLQQAKQKNAGDEEAMYFDKDYVTALEYGMPPTGGCGIGIDRLAMLLTDASSIRDVILFPSLKTRD